MSETVNENTPCPYEVVRECRGIARWKPVLTSLEVQKVPDGVHVVIFDDGDEKYRFMLSPDDAQHLSEILSQEERPL